MIRHNDSPPAIPTPIPNGSPPHWIVRRLPALAATLLAGAHLDAAFRLKAALPAPVGNGAALRRVGAKGNQGLGQDVTRRQLPPGLEGMPGWERAPQVPASHRLRLQPRVVVGHAGQAQVGLAAHQQASHMFKQIRCRLKGEPLQPFIYRDFGSLVSLGEYSTVGSLMGSIAGKGMMIEGWFARMMYRSLYKMHETALHGWFNVVLSTLSRILTSRAGPYVKLH